MAYVAISNELQSAVRDGIRAMHRKELAAVGEVPCLEGTEPFVEKALWGKYAHLKPMMPAEWKKKANSITMRITFPEGAWQEYVSLKAPQEAPPTYNTYDQPKVIFSHDDPTLTSFVSVITNRQDAHKRWKGVEEQVMQFLTNCRSLNEGLKLWPDLRMYVPKQYLDRVERKVERSKDESNAAREALKNIDTNQVVAAAVIARISSSSDGS